MTTLAVNCRDVCSAHSACLKSNRAATLALLMVGGAFTANIAQAGSITFSFSNDDVGTFEPLFGDLNDDISRDDYTQGLFLGYSHDLNERDQISFYLAHDMFSPSGDAKLNPTATPGDRAFCGYFFGGVDWNSRPTDWFRYRLGLDVGVVGPDAGGEELQDTLHWLISAEKYRAWNDQVRNRHGYAVKGMATLTPSVDLGSLNAGLYPHLSAVGGNLFSFVGFGASVALGNDRVFNSDNGFGLLSRRGMFQSATPGFFYKVFAGVEFREVDKSYILEGHTEESGLTTVDLNRWVDEYRVGGAIGFSSMAFSMTLHKITSEFKTGMDYTFINLSASYRF